MLFNAQAHQYTSRLHNPHRFMAHRVQHNNSRGPYKGGIKMHPDATLEDVERQAATWQHQTACCACSFLRAWCCRASMCD